MKLKPCPFCGGKAVKAWDDFNDDRYIKCEKCGAGTAMFHCGITWSYIADCYWNRRHKEERNVKS